LLLALFVAIAPTIPASRAAAQSASPDAPTCAPSLAATALGVGDPAVAPRHPLIGHVVTAARIEPRKIRTDCSDALEDALAWLREAPLVVVGEVHDNPWHHRLKAALIASLRERAPRALVFEHLRADQTPILDALNARTASAGPPPTPDEVFAAVDWKASGWPDPTLFAPAFAAALDRRHPLVAGDPPRAKIRDVARNGLDALAPAEARLVTGSPWSEPQQAALLDELEASHCGLMPRGAFTNMALAQRYRDAHLARALSTNAPAILFAGNGHARRDRGVPSYLASMPKAASGVRSLILIEVEDAKTDQAAYRLHGIDGGWLADVILFTPRADRKDPCEEMRAMMQKKKP
jgi:uncharacterized iron-regulated protein